MGYALVLRCSFKTLGPQALSLKSSGTPPRTASLHHMQKACALLRKAVSKNAIREYTNYATVYHRMNWFIPKQLSDIEFPLERRKLRPVPRTPDSTSDRVSKLPRRLIDIRGPELIHNSLLHEQYGLQALGGGNLKYEHFEVIRTAVNRIMDDKRMFAQWRVEAPWKPWTYKGIGRTLGGGKGDIKYFVTPVKAGRIIFELGGHLNWWEAFKLINNVAPKMPFEARFVSIEMLQMESKMEQYVQETNINPFTFDYCMKHNLYDCHRITSPYNHHWGANHR